MTTFPLHPPRLFSLRRGFFLQPLQLKGWHLFLLLVACEALLTWFYQSRILTREVYHTLLQAQLDAQRIDALFDLLQRMSLWGFAAIPLIIGLRIMLVASLLQLPLVLRFIDIPFRQLFRIVAAASLLFILLEGVRLLRLSGIPAEQLTQANLNWMPLALTSLLRLEVATASVQGFFSHFNLFEIGWLALLYFGLSRTGQLRKRDAGLVVLVMWTVVVLFQWGLTLYMERM
ncbi:MAG: hypothetical protein BWY77_00780 [bacterium ADurb.Bin431]|nr:MAG: hypothetical protein BWY77_00780 [bacterium ADurb.Bin431]